MAKGKHKESPEERAQRKLADAHAKLQSAQARRARAVTRGEQEVERARSRAAARLERATQEVERRAGKVAREEARLITVRRKYAQPRGGNPVPQNPPATPDEAADVLETLALDADDANGADDPPEVLVRSDSDDISDSGAEPREAGNGERRLLAALNTDTTGGSTFSEWLASSGVSKKTFLRLRQVLVERGVVIRDGDGRGARYRLAVTDTSPNESR